MIRAAYSQLGIEYSLAFNRRLEDYLKTLGDFQKNRFASLPHDQQAAIDLAMADFSNRWGYTASNAAQVAHRAA